MRPRPRPVLVLGFVAAMAAVYYSQNPPSPLPSRTLKEAAEYLRGYYHTKPSREVTEITTGPGVVWVDVRAPRSATNERDGNDVAGTTARLRPVCPSGSDIAWKILLPDQDIEVRAVSPSGQPLIAISCRTANNQRGYLRAPKPSLAEQFLHRTQRIG